MDRQNSNHYDMRDDLDCVLFSAEQIRARVKELGAQLSKEYEGKNPVFLGILKGVVVFFTDLIRAVDVPMQMDFITISSYRNGTTSGKHEIRMNTSEELHGRHVVVVEDIIDSGRTLTLLKNEILSREPASFKVVTLLDKKERREVPFEPDLIGFDCPNEFVVGYGLDFDERYRNLPYVGILKREVYS